MKKESIWDLIADDVDDLLDWLTGSDKDKKDN